MIRTFEYGTDAQAIINALKQDGAVVIKEILDKGNLQKLNSECQSILNNTDNCSGYFYGFETKRVASMVSKSNVCRSMATNETILKVMDHFLLPHCDQYQLNLSQLISIGPDEKQQILHADDPMFPFEHSTDVQVMINVMWAIDDFTKENGATHIVPKSHVWERDRHPEKNEVEQAVMSKGSCFIWLGSSRHGGGANHTNMPRRGIVMSYNLGWLKQADNYFLGIPKEEVKVYPERLQQLLGYFVHRPNLNMVEGRDPIETLSDNLTGSQFTEFMPNGVESILKEHFDSQNCSVSEVKYNRKAS